MVRKKIIDQKGYTFSKILLILSILFLIAVLAAFVVSCICSSTISEAKFALQAQRIDADEYQNIKDTYQSLNNTMTFLFVIGIPVVVTLFLLTKHSFNRSVVKINNLNNSDQFEVYKSINK